ncbi:MAG: triose-phosphate isomerase [Candidatus Magasanikiibacteriota bacterium]
MKYIFANWKMYLDFDESNILANALLLEKIDFNKIELCLFPSALALREMAMVLNQTDVKVGAQNINWNPKGAYTGEISAQMYKDVGCKYALVGHSERRHVFGETDEEVRKKIEACLEVGLIPVVCVGETKEDKDEGKREYRLKKQLMRAFENLDLSNKEIIIAYEPVWAISKAGVGEACSAEEADDVHGWIKNELKQYTDKVIPVVYGGSANEKNVVSLLSQEMIDGVLPGNASTKFETFISLIHGAEQVS